jgi:hypothetical protein
MKKFLNKYSVFFTGLLQVTFVSMNTVFISKGLLLPMLIAGFMISLIWTFNVKRVAFGGWIDRIEYAAGATAGTGLGYFIAQQISKLL